MASCSIFKYLQNIKFQLLIIFSISVLLKYYKFFFLQIQLEDKINNTDQLYFFLDNFLIFCLIVISIFTIGKIIYYGKYGNQFQIEKHKIIKEMTSHEYSYYIKEITKSEKRKLFENPKFIEMITKKGSDESKWNWQLRAKIKGKMNNISDDEISEITVSDNDES